MSKQEITFYDNHLPVLLDGEYVITVEQNVSVIEHATPIKTIPEKFSSNLKVYVNGPKFQLDPSEFHTIYPQDGATGDFEGTLPSISFTRSTLLWEREAMEGDKSIHAPWLYLLLVDESEQDSIQEGNYEYSQLLVLDEHGNKKRSDIAKSLGIEIDDDLKFISQDKPVQYIDLKDFKISDEKTFVIPQSLEELKYLGYTRINAVPIVTSETKVDDNDKENDDDSEEHCVVVGNRLPKPGSNSTVYLISLEHKYTSDGKLDGSKKIFPVLHKWKFYTNDDQLYSIQLNLDKIKLYKDKNNVGISLTDEVKSNTDIFDTTKEFNDFLSHKVSDDDIKKMRIVCKLPGGSFHDVMSNLRNGIKSIDIPSSLVHPLASTGSVNLPSYTINKDDGKAVPGNAWYRGPLVAKSLNLDSAKFSPDTKLQKDKNKPLFIDEQNGFIPFKADELLITVDGTTDMTYAVAYELGKLTALSDTGFSSAFFEWKHHVATAKAYVNQSNQDQHLAIQNKYDPGLPMPPSVLEKFKAWKLLKGLPIRYLVPDPAMVPSESIRYFRVDNNWVNAFIMGAFSIGHTVKADFSSEISGLFLKRDTVRTGFILNSLAVSVWHDYELDCETKFFDKSTLKWVSTPKDKLLLRKSNLDKFTHIYLFEGQISELKFHLHPGKLHPGFMVEKSGDSTTFHKPPNNSNVTKCVDLNTRIVTMEALSGSDLLNTGSIAQFNSKLMEGTPEVVYKIT